MQKMNPYYKSLWVEALRSGKYKQCTGEYMIPGDVRTCYYCVLGVLAKVIAKDKHRRFQDYAIRSRLYDAAALDPIACTRLIEYNDDAQRSFNWLAGYIERYL